MANPLSQLGQRYRNLSSSLISPALRGIDAGAMSPAERSRLLFSEASPEVVAESLRDGTSKKQSDFDLTRKDAERIVRQNRANADKPLSEIQREISHVQGQLERGRERTTVKEVNSGSLNNADENLVLRALLSSPEDKAATALLNDPKFAEAVGTSTDELLRVRQELDSAAQLASRIQQQKPTARGMELEITQNPDVDAVTLLNKARVQPTNANLNAALDAIRNPTVTRTADPSAWDASANIDVPWSLEAEQRTLERYHTNPITGEKVDRGQSIKAPGAGRLTTESLSSFLNRAYGKTSAANDALPGRINTDFDGFVDLEGDTPAAQAWREANSLRQATEAAEVIGAQASERAGAMTTAQKLQKLQSLVANQGNKADGIRDPEVQRATQQLLELEGRSMSEAEKARLLENINATRPGVLDDALELMARLPKTLDLDGSKITAQAMRAADRAGFDFSNTTGGSKRFKTNQAQSLHDFLTSPKTGLSAASLGALTAAGALAAGIRGDGNYEYEYISSTGEPFSNSVRDETLYRLRMADPLVLAAAIQNAESY